MCSLKENSFIKEYGDSAYNIAASRDCTDQRTINRELHRTCFENLVKSRRTEKLSNQRNAQENLLMALDCAEYARVVGFYIVNGFYNGSTQFLAKSRCGKMANDKLKKYHLKSSTSQATRPGELHKAREAIRERLKLTSDEIATELNMSANVSRHLCSSRLTQDEIVSMAEEESLNLSNISQGSRADEQASSRLAQFMHILGDRPSEKQLQTLRRIILQRQVSRYQRQRYNKARASSSQSHLRKGSAETRFTESIRTQNTLPKNSAKSVQQSIANKSVMPVEEQFDSKICRLMAKPERKAGRAVASNPLCRRGKSQPRIEYANPEGSRTQVKYRKEYSPERLQANELVRDNPNAGKMLKKLRYTRQFRRVVESVSFKRCQFGSFND